MVAAAMPRVIMEKMVTVLSGSIVLCDVVVMLVTFMAIPENYQVVMWWK